MIKLTGNKRKILKFIYKNNGKYTRFNLSEYLKSIPKEEILIHIDSLQKNNYITFKGVNEYIFLTSQGLSYFSDETSDNLETCIKSILCPVIVSFVVSLLTSLLTLWLKCL